LLDGRAVYVQQEASVIRRHPLFRALAWLNTSPAAALFLRAAHSRRN
jgi:hypothetical protein